MDEPAPADAVSRVDFAERWLGDGFRAIEGAGGALSLDVDVSGVAPLLERLRAAGVRATYNHVIVRATALALSRLPALHVLPAGNRRLRPARVDLGLSVAGETSFAPVMVLEDAARKPLVRLAAEVIARVPEVRAKEQVDLANLRRFGFLLPFSFLRRFVLSLCYRSLAFRRKLAGTFQVTCVATVDRVLPMRFLTAGCLGVGRARDRVVAVDGQPAVRKVVTLVCAFDHTVWDGARAGALLEAVRRVLEEGELDAEVAHAPSEPASI